MLTPNSNKEQRLDQRKNRKPNLDMPILLLLKFPSSIITLLNQMLFHLAQRRRDFFVFLSASAPLRLGANTFYYLIALGYNFTFS